MKNKLITSIFIIVSIIFITTIVQAVSIQITLPEDLKKSDMRRFTVSKYCSSCYK